MESEKKLKTYTITLVERQWRNYTTTVQACSEEEAEAMCSDFTAEQMDGGHEYDEDEWFVEEVGE